MKVLTALFAALLGALLIPVFILNIVGGLGSGIWLAVLGNWAPIFIGIVVIVISSCLWPIAMMPTFLCIAPLVKLAEGRRYFLFSILAFVCAFYTLSVVTVWSVLVMWYFREGAAESNYIPLMIWSYGVATSPFVFMYAKDQNNNVLLATIASASIAYIVAGLWVLLGHPAIRDTNLVFLVIMSLGACFMFFSSLAVIRYNKNKCIY